MKRISSKDFSKKRADLILQIRWLLNEMDYARSCIRSEAYDEADKILSKETVNNHWMTMKSQ